MPCHGRDEDAVRYDDLMADSGVYVARVEGVKECLGSGFLGKALSECFCAVKGGVFPWYRADGVTHDGWEDI